MTLKEKGRKPTPDTPATGVGASLEYRVVQTHTTGKRHAYPSAGAFTRDPGGDDGGT